jgi:hypothetical protein
VVRRKFTDVSEERNASIFREHATREMEASLRKLGSDIAKTY